MTIDIAALNLGYGPSFADPNLWYPPMDVGPTSTQANSLRGVMFALRVAEFSKWIEKIGMWCATPNGVTCRPYVYAEKDNGQPGPLMIECPEVTLITGECVGILPTRYRTGIKKAYIGAIFGNGTAEPVMFTGGGNGQAPNTDGKVTRRGFATPGIDYPIVPGALPPDFPTTNYGVNSSTIPFFCMKGSAS